MTNPQTQGQLIASTLNGMDNIVIDNMSTNNALWFKLKEKNKIKKSSGGKNFEIKINYAGNNTIKGQTAYGNLDTTPQDVLTHANFGDKIVTATMSFSTTELNQNKGKAQMIDLVTNSTTVLNDSLQTKFGEYTYNDGSDALLPGGIQNLIADDPTTGTVGLINRANFSFWRNQMRSFLAQNKVASKDTILEEMSQLYRLCQNMSNRKVPDLIAMDNNYYSFFEQSQQANQRFSDSSLANAGFVALKFHGSDVIYDPGCPVNHAYFMNTDSIQFQYLGENLVNRGEKRVPVAQLAEVHPVYIQGNFTMSNCRINGVLKT